MILNETSIKFKNDDNNKKEEKLNINEKTENKENNSSGFNPFSNNLNINNKVEKEEKEMNKLIINQNKEITEKDKLKIEGDIINKNIKQSDNKNIYSKTVTKKHYININENNKNIIDNNKEKDIIINKTKEEETIKTQIKPKDEKEQINATKSTVYYAKKKPQSKKNITNSINQNIDLETNININKIEKPKTEILLNKDYKHDEHKKEKKKENKEDNINYNIDNKDINDNNKIKTKINKSEIFSHKEELPKQNVPKIQNEIIITDKTSKNIKTTFDNANLSKDNILKTNDIFSNLNNINNKIDIKPKQNIFINNDISNKTIENKNINFGIKDTEVNKNLEIKDKTNIKENKVKDIKLDEKLII